jgi:hypothetical protein
LAKFNTAMMAFNRGLVSALALARIDLKRLALSAEVFTNWMPRTLGSMMLRPGLEYILTAASAEKIRLMLFIFAVDDTAIIELTDGQMRVIVNDAEITRVAVSTTVTNTDFTTDLSGWTDTDEAGATSAQVTFGAYDDSDTKYMSLIGTGTNAAIRKQTLVVSAPDSVKVHAINIKIDQGKVLLRVGSTDDGDDLIAETELLPGYHSLAFDPDGATSVYVRVANRNKYAALIDSIEIASAGVMTLTTPWELDDLDNVRYDQSGDILFVACKGRHQKRIERRADESWSVVDFFTEDGPFRFPNTTPITLTPSAISGDITLTASKGLFKESNLKSLFRITSTGQQVSASIAAQNQWSNEIRVTGIGSGRIFGIVITGIAGSTVTLQRSVEEPGAWVSATTYTTDGTRNFNDALDNQIIYYRIGIATGGFVGGPVSVSLTYSAGSISGVVKITNITSETVASAQVLVDLGGIVATDNWEEGEWSERRGYPSAVAFHEGRLWWAGQDDLRGSVSDAFSVYDDETEGDSGPISRSIGSGPVDTINWMVSGQRLVVGGQGAEFTAQSSSIDEPLSPTNFNIKSASTQGSNDTSAVKIDSSIIFVQRSGRRVYEMTQQDQFGTYTTADLTAVIPEIGGTGIRRLATQRQPDTRVHCIRNDGTVAVLVTDASEEVKCWVNVETDGIVIDAISVPSNSVEDDVYYAVQRTVDGTPRIYIEKWAYEDDCQGGDLNKQADSFVEYDGVPTTTITGLDHLEGEEVVIWADGLNAGTATVTSGEITLTTAASKVIVGLYYQARFKSTKLAYNADMGTPLLQEKRVDHIGMILYNTHHMGVKYGKNFDEASLHDIPQVIEGAVVAEGTIFESFDHSTWEFEGDWGTDSRVCLVAESPKPATVLAAVISMAQHDK